MQHVTFIGNAAATPELRYAPSGVASVRLSVICQDRYRDAAGQWQDGKPHTVFVSAFRDFAERIAASVERGDRVVVVGSFSTDQVEKDGETKYYTNFVAEELAVSCRWAEVKSRRVSGSRSSAGSASPTGAGPAASTGDPWSSSSVPADAPAFAGA